MHQTYACRFRQIPANMHKKVEKCQQETIAIDKVNCRNKLATICLHKLSTICLHKLDEVKCRNKYLEMNKPTRFQGEQLVYIFIGGAIWLDKENQIK